MGRERSQTHAPVSGSVADLGPEAGEAARTRPTSSASRAVPIWGTGLFRPLRGKAIQVQVRGRGNILHAVSTALPSAWEAPWALCGCHRGAGPAGFGAQRTQVEATQAGLTVNVRASQGGGERPEEEQRGICVDVARFRVCFPADAPLICRWGSVSESTRRGLQGARLGAQEGSGHLSASPLFPWGPTKHRLLYKCPPRPCPRQSADGRPLGGGPAPCRLLPWP